MYLTFTASSVVSAAAPEIPATTEICTMYEIDAAT